MSKPVLDCQKLNVWYADGTHAVRGIDFTIDAGECLALVGESGCGKTTIGRAILGLLPTTARITGQIELNGRSLLQLSQDELRQLRGRSIGFVAQNPFAACNPLDRIAQHVEEPWRAHRQRPPQYWVLHALARLGITQAESRMHQYPHQWSGGMLQRATIAAAAAYQPALIIADEPTSALDADHADTTLQALRSTGATLLLISHNIDVVIRHADRVAVCYAGRIVEIGSIATVISNPRHPYTRALLAATPRKMHQIPRPLPGTPPRLNEPITGCAFAPRCVYTQESCNYIDPPLKNGVACPIVDTLSQPLVTRNNLLVSELDIPQAQRRAEPVLTAHQVSKQYGRGKQKVVAVHQASLTLYQSEIVGISGASGCGKSTLLRLLSTLELPDTGEVRFGEFVVTRGGTKRLLHSIARQAFAMPIFQDPTSSLDPRWPIWRSVTEPLLARHRPNRLNQAQRRAIANEWLAAVGLDHLDLDARPSELSIGQCQRVAIARALVAQPSVIIADEPTSALDVSVAAAIMQVLVTIARRGTALIIVSHDRRLLEAVCDRVLSMRAGVLYPS